MRFLPNLPETVLANVQVAGEHPFPYRLPVFGFKVSVVLRPPRLIYVVQARLSIASRKSPATFATIKTIVAKATVTVIVAAKSAIFILRLFP